MDNKHKAGTAAVLSFVFSGLGQIYNGQISKGLVLMFFTTLSLLLIVLGASFIYIWLTQKVILELVWLGMALFAIGIALTCVIGFYSITDAYKKGGKIQ